jgi:hypothetical protein
MTAAATVRVVPVAPGEWAIRDELAGKLIGPFYTVELAKAELVALAACHVTHACAGDTFFCDLCGCEFADKSPHWLCQVCERDAEVFTTANPGWEAAVQAELAEEGRS